MDMSNTRPADAAPLAQDGRRRVVIEVEHLTAGYDKPLQRDLNFSVFAGEIFVILGGSGCGKSTVLKHRR